MPKRILVIEDSNVMLRVLSRKVREVGHIPVEATSMAETQAALQESPDFLCAIMDYHLPDALEGQTLPILLAANVPTIILTGMSEGPVRDRLLQEPIFDYVPKESPAALEYVAKLIKRVERNPVIKVLLVDDSAAIRAHLHSLLARQKYQVIEAADAQTALQILKTEPGIRLVLADQEMPGMDGLRMTSEIRRLYGYDRIAIIGISGSNDPNMTARFIKAGADDYLQKPFNNEEFFCRITRNIEFIENIEALARAAYEDSLTGLPNRRLFFAKAESVPPGYSLAIIDVDYFKKVNDTYGHDVGDLALKHLAKHIRSEFTGNIFARFGGEEFVVLLKGHNPMAHRQKLNDFCKKIEANPLTLADKSLPLTVSIGFASSAEADLTRMLKQADEKLYEAKTQGRNRVCP